MLQLGIIRPSSSSLCIWSGDWRPCEDYLALNNITVPDRSQSHIYKTSLPPYMVLPSFQNLILLEHTTRFLLNELIFLKLLSRLYSGCLNLFACHLDFETSHRHSRDSLIKFFVDFCYVYIDDVLVASANAEEHEEHLQAVFQCPSEHSIIINQFRNVNLPFINSTFSDTKLVVTESNR